MKFEITCEMMKNQKQASPVATNESLLVVQDKQQNPLFFSIGDDSQLYLIKTDPNSKTSGNSSVNLLSLGGITADFTAAVSVGVNQVITGFFFFVIFINNPYKRMQKAESPLHLLPERMAIVEQQFLQQHYSTVMSLISTNGPPASRIT